MHIHVVPTKTLEQSWIEPDAGILKMYHNDPKFSNSRGAVWSGSALFAIQSASFGRIILWLNHIIQILG